MKAKISVYDKDGKMVYQDECEIVKIIPMFFILVDTFPNYSLRIDKHEEAKRLLIKHYQGEMGGGVIENAVLKIIDEVFNAMKIKLKPCPFCGGEASMLRIGDDMLNLGCDKCKAMMIGKEDDVIKNWNARV